MPLNKAILIGNLTADPELKQTPSGITVTSFTIAINRRKAKEENEGQQTADFISIVAWRQTAEFICRYFKKGKPIQIVGALQSRSYTDNQGNKRYVTEVVADEAAFVDGGKDGNANANANANANTNANAGNAYVPAAYTNVGTTAPNFEDLAAENDLPF